MLLRLTVITITSNEVSFEVIFSTKNSSKYFCLITNVTKIFDNLLSETYNRFVHNRAKERG